MSDDTVLVTGAAGFIGFHVAQRLLSAGREVVGLDSRQQLLRSETERSAPRYSETQSEFQFREARSDRSRGNEGRCSTSIAFRLVVHLAAQAGVRYSLEHPHAYVDANLEGFVNVLEGCRHNGCKHLLFASSSSVYGANTKLPFSVQDNVDHPVSLYAASKKANELMAHAYSHLYRIPATGLRFFTVYGPWGRPDMAMFHFRQGDPGRAADQAVQSWQHATRFHLRRRCQRGRRPPDRSSAAGQSGLVRRQARSGDQRRAMENLQYRQQQARRTDARGFACWRRNSAARQTRRCCRCSQATCRRPMPISRISRAISDFGPRPRSKMVSRGLQNGIVTITSSERQGAMSDALFH